MQSLISLDPLSRPVRVLLLAVSSFALVAMIAYPFGYDQAAFTVGGEMIAREGAVPYRDFIDTKPPIIFYLYALANVLFGHNTWGIRVIDILVQLCTAVLLYRLVWDWSEIRQLAFLTPVLYLVHYASQGYWMTAQAEGFAALPLVLLTRIFWKLDDDRILLHALVTGLLIAALFFLKFTLVIITAGFLLYLVFRTDIRSTVRWTFSLLSILFGCSFIAIALIVLYFIGAWDNLTASIAWVQHYASIGESTVVSGGFRRHFISELIHSHHLTFVILALIAILGFAKRSITETSSEFKGFILLLCLCYLFAMASVISERKFFPYHYSRAFVFFTPFVAVGILVVVRYAKTLLVKWRALGQTQRTVSWVFAGLGLLTALFFSPAVQLYSQSFLWSKAVMLGEDREFGVQRRIPNYFAYEQKLVGQYIQQHATQKDNVFFWGNSVGVYYYARKLPTTFALTNTPFITPWTPEGWRNDLLHQLMRSSPRYIVVEWGDQREYISASEDDSYRHLVRWQGLRDYVFEHYTEVKRIGHFLIYGRR